MRAIIRLTNKLTNKLKSWLTRETGNEEEKVWTKEGKWV